MKNAEVIPLNDTDLLLNEPGLLADPRPTVDREKLQHHLREALRLLHVDLERKLG